MEDLVINEHLIVPATELQATFARSGGPGGQNVNKVNSKATIAWDLGVTQALLPGTLARLRVIAKSRITDAGILQITSQIHREQPRNLQACREILRQLILQAMKPPTIRRPTQPTRGSQRRRLEGKKITSDKKQNRSSGNWE
jgi:ribosome-associated protein